MVERAVCPVAGCFEVMKINSKNNKIWFQEVLSNKKSGRLTYMCTNHDDNVYFTVQHFYSNDALSAVRNYVFHSVLPSKKHQKS